MLQLCSESSRRKTNYFLYSSNWPKNRFYIQQPHSVLYPWSRDGLMQIPPHRWVKHNSILCTIQSNMALSLTPVSPSGVPVPLFCQSQSLKRHQWVKTQRCRRVILNSNFLGIFQAVFKKKTLWHVGQRALGEDVWREEIDVENLEKLFLRMFYFAVRSLSLITSTGSVLVHSSEVQKYCHTQITISPVRQELKVRISAQGRTRISRFMNTVQCTYCVR